MRGPVPKIVGPGRLASSLCVLTCSFGGFVGGAPPLDFSFLYHSIKDLLSQLAVLSNFLFASTLHCFEPRVYGGFRMSNEANRMRERRADSACLLKPMDAPYRLSATTFGE